MTAPGEGQAAPAAGAIFSTLPAPTPPERDSLNPGPGAPGGVSRPSS
jgi:hypothetical protein